MKLPLSTNHSSVFLFLWAVIILQGHTGLVGGTGFNLLRQLWCTSLALEELLRVVSFQGNSGNKKKNRLRDSTYTPFKQTKTFIRGNWKHRWEGLRVWWQAAVIGGFHTICLFIVFKHLIRIPTIWLRRRQFQKCDYGFAPYCTSCNRRKITLKRGLKWLIALII